MPLPVTASLVEDSATRLASDGWHYTQRQLYYATCARAETPRTNAAANGEIGLGVLLVLIGLILIGIKVAFVLFVSLGAALVLAGVLGRVRRPAVTGRPLALSFDEFRTRFGDLEVVGMIDPNAAPPVTVADVTPATTVICDTGETASLVAANLDRAGLPGTVVVTGAQDQAATPSGKVVAFHDASPRGCALVLDLRDAGMAVEDAGLRPSDVDGPAHQVIEGAPARLPRDLRPLLRPDEIDWLLSGRRVEIATLAPEVAMDRVLAAVRRVDPLPDGARQPAR